MTPRGLRGATVVKLGGSVVSDKRVSFSYRERVVASLARAISSSKVPVVVVHGGGSFGHPMAKRFGLSSTRSGSSKGVSETRAAMLSLDAKVCASLAKAGLRPYPFSPFSLLEREGGRTFLERLIRGRMTPVTFGDVVPDGKGFRVLSGDTICVELAGLLEAGVCVMAMDVAGLLDDQGRVIEVVEEGRVPRLALMGRSSDSTGGIRFKLQEALRMAAFGTEVRLVSGLHPAEFAKALKRVTFKGTTVRVPDGVFRGPDELPLRRGS